MPGSSDRHGCRPVEWRRRSHRGRGRALQDAVVRRSATGALAGPRPAAMHLHGGRAEQRKQLCLVVVDV